MACADAFQGMSESSVPATSKLISDPVSRRSIDASNSFAMTVSNANPEPETSNCFHRKVRPRVSGLAPVCPHSATDGLERTGHRPSIPDGSAKLRSGEWGRPGVHSASRRGAMKGGSVGRGATPCHHNPVLCDHPQRDERLARYARLLEFCIHRQQLTALKHTPERLQGQ